MLNALRLTDGVPSSLYAERTGTPLSAAARMIALATDKGLLSPDPSRLAPTELGRRFLNDLQALFLADPPSAARAVHPPAQPMRMQPPGVSR
jgi:oxygen-independent coproporphyrinogen-3 oxidase